METVSIFKKEKQKQVGRIILFQPTHSSSRLRIARACPRSSGHKVGTYPGQDALLSQGTLTHTPHPDLGS